MSNNVLITGAGNRIGAVIASELAAGGFRVVIHYNKSGREAQQLVATITAGGGRAALLRADLSVSSQRSSVIEQAAKPFGPLGVLINNASVFEPDSALTISERLWDAHFEVHAKAPLFLSRDFARQLPPGEKGNIINIIDERVLRHSPAFFSYNLSKSVLWSATRTLAQSLAPDIRVNAIGPGPVLASTRQSKAQFERSIKSLPLKTGASPGDIALAVKFLLSSPSITGQMLALDGGEHLEWRGRDELTHALP